MIHTITMPRLSLSMTEGTLLTWQVKVGDRVEKDQPLCTIEGEKATEDLKAPASGVLIAISGTEGETYPIGTPIAQLADAGETAETAGPIEKLTQQAAAGAQWVADAVGEAARSAAGAVTPALHEARLRITPKARKLAKDLGVSLDMLLRKYGERRVTEADVAETHRQGEAADAPPEALPWAPLSGLSSALGMAPDPVWDSKGETPPSVAGFAPLTPPPGPETPPPADFVSAAPALAAASDAPDRMEPASPMRRLIAANMTGSLSASAQLTNFMDVDVTELLALIASLKAQGVRLSVTGMIVKTAAMALMEHEIVNAGFDGERIIYHPAANIGCAVDVPGGLMVPVIKGAQALSPLEITARIDDMAKAAVQGTLPAQAMSGGTFTVSNVGMLDVYAFTPIIRQPESAILGVGAVRLEPCYLDGDTSRLVPRSRMMLSLTYDHRLVDGAPAARFLQSVKRSLEHPTRLMVTLR